MSVSLIYLHVCWGRKSHGTCVEIGEQLRKLGSDSIMWAPGIKLR